MTSENFHTFLKVWGTHNLLEDEQVMVRSCGCGHVLGHGVVCVAWIMSCLVSRHGVASVAWLISQPWDRIRERRVGSFSLSSW